MSRALTRSFLIGVLALQPVAAAAQQQDTAALRRQLEQQLGMPLTQQDIVERLRASGMTRSQLRERLRAMGYDPALADPYFDAMSSGETLTGRPTGNVIQALERLGITPRPDSIFGAPPDGRGENGDTVAANAAGAGGLPIFGMSLFENARNQFQPTTYGPVGEDYRLGPGDQLVLILTGSLEDAYELRVTRQGFIVVPGAGQLFVAGLTMAELEARLRTLLGQVYSGVEGEDGRGRLRFQISLAELRTNQVYLIGEVEEPGAYQVNAAGSVLNALYHAAGPNELGSFRRIEIRRGGDLAGTVDLYDYLLTGGSEADTQLRDGDRIFVPVVGPRVSIDGEIRRPARYELLPGERLRDLVTFAGGFRAEAVIGRIQIDRILPVEERRPGVDRVFIDVPLADLLSDAGGTPLRDGDRVTVFAVSHERRHLVTLSGDVNRAGTYQWTPAMTLQDLLDRANGLGESAYLHRAQIHRLNPADGSRYLIPTSLEGAPGDPPPASLLPLEDRDSVVVFSRSDLVATDSVGIRGFVKRPGVYRFVEGMTLEDLILAADGFTTGANTVAAELARVAAGEADREARSTVFSVPLDIRTESLPGAAPVPDWRPAAGQVRLQPGDRVFIRQAAGYEGVRSVVLTGEVVSPGLYALEEGRERLTDVVARAGGLTDRGYAPGLQLIRDSTLLGVDLPEALRRPDGIADVPLLHGDSIHVPRYDPTVRVRGAVAFDSRVVYVPGKGLDYYIERAGGYAPNADRNGASVTYQNGHRETVRVIGPFSRAPRPEPGSEIFVPATPTGLPSGINWGDLLTRGATIIGTIATLIIAIQR